MQVGSIAPNRVLPVLSHTRKWCVARRSSLRRYELATFTSRDSESRRLLRKVADRSADRSATTGGAVGDYQFTACPQTSLFRGQTTQMPHSRPSEPRNNPPSVGFCSWPDPILFDETGGFRRYCDKSLLSCAGTLPPASRSNGASQMSFRPLFSQPESSNPPPNAATRVMVAARPRPFGQVGSRQQQLVAMAFFAAGLLAIFATRACGQAAKFPSIRSRCTRN